MNDCVFCKVIKGELPGTFLYQDADVVVIKNIEPVATHHYLVIPKKHVTSFVEMGDEILQMMKVAKKVIGDLKISDGYKLVFNGGKYQSVPHVHWHLLAGNLEGNDDILNQT